MRRVYSPPPSGGGWSLSLAASLAMTLAVFLVLPLTQLVSSYAKRDLLVSKVDATVLEAPQAPDEPPPPPPKEEPPDEPEPKLAEAEPQLSINVDLDMAVGSGGAMTLASLGGPGDGSAQEMAQALDVSDLDKPPTLVSSVPPNYPPELRRTKVEGSVVLVFVLNEQGRVEDPRVETSTRPEFEQPAVDAVKRWRFKPGEKEGETVRTYMRLPMRFRVAS
jgi:protein TonB